MIISGHDVEILVLTYNPGLGENERSKYKVSSRWNSDIMPLRICRDPEKAAFEEFACKYGIQGEFIKIAYMPCINATIALIKQNRPMAITY